MTWVKGRFRFDHPSIVSDSALEIIPEGAKGGRFFCLQYADVMLACANSLGYTSRLMDIRLREPGTEHTVTDVWSNQFRKWVIFDATVDAYYERKDDVGIPLSSYEIRSERIKTENKNMQQVVGEKREKKDATLVSVSKYAFLMYIGNNNLLDSPKDFGDNAFMLIDDWNREIPWHRRESPTNPNEMFWTLGEAKIALYDAGVGKLDVVMTTQTPGFATYLVKVNEGPWQPSGDTFTWTLHKGENKITTTTQNIRGVTGPENHISLKY